MPYLGCEPTPVWLTWDCICSIWPGSSLMNIGPASCVPIGAFKSGFSLGLEEAERHTHHLSLMFPEWGASFSLSGCCWDGLCSWSPHMWAVLTQPKALGPQGLRGQQSPGCHLISRFHLQPLLPPQQVQFRPPYFVSKSQGLSLS